MKKILIVSTNADKAGVPIHILELAHGLKRSHSLSFLFGEKGPIYKELQDDNYDVAILNGLKSKWSPIKNIYVLYKFYKVLRIAISWGVSIK